MTSKKTNSNKRLTSTKQYFDTLTQNYSKLNLVRVDLGYKKPYSGEISLEDANKDLNHMFNNMRSKPTIFKDVVGYVCKREYTEDRGVHFHTLMVYNGQKVQKDAYMGDQIGKYWEKITAQKGSFHNCNRNSYEQTGIGMLDYKDKEKRQILDEKVLSYICKDEQSIDAIKTKKKSRAFTRGVMPKTKSHIGRPRENG